MAANMQNYNLTRPPVPPNSINLVNTVATEDKQACMPVRKGCAMKRRTWLNGRDFGEGRKINIGEINA